ncbi:MAG: PQQ-binding-like beta-propeller repeat protein [Ignavibacteria bacterium]|nr:PQQ-binding-like beta-propeller repeat protein [Ignavibacteria bacterium]
MNFKILLLFFLTMTFKSPAQVIDSTYPEDIDKMPSLNWKYSSGKPIFSSPVIADGMVFAGGDDNIFRALDLENGISLWEFKSNGRIRSAPLIENDLIYLNGGDGTLYCLNMKGDVIWSSSAGYEKQYDFADYHQSSPVIYDKTIFFGLGDGYVYAVDSENGKLKWKYETGGVVHSTPVIDSGKLYIGSFDGYVYALNVSDGSLVWKFKTVGHQYFPLGEVQGSPAIYNDLVFIGARDYNVYALDKDKGYCHWNKTFRKGWVLSNTVNDTALFMAGADERILSAVDPQTGKENWKKDMEFLMFGKPAFSKSVLYIGTTIGKLHGINSNTGEKLWTYSTDGYRDNRLKYFKEDDSYRNDIYSIIKSNEQFLEVEIELGGIFSSPALQDGYLVFASTDGSLYCLKNQ